MKPLHLSAVGDTISARSFRHQSHSFERTKYYNSEIHKFEKRKIAVS